jgi:hypothetical protein
MNGYLNYQVSKELMSDRVAAASRQRLRVEIKKARRGSKQPSAPSSPAAYCRQLVASVLRAIV